MPSLDLQETSPRSVPHLVYGFPLSFIVLFLLSGSIQAIPLADYHKNLQQAISALDTLLQQDEGESLADYQKRVNETSAAVRAALPKKQVVQSGADICNVDNSWLHAQLEEFEKAADSERPTIVAHTLERLQAIEERVAEMEKPGLPSASKTEATERLAAILRRSEYAQQSRQGSAVARLWRDLVRWLLSLLPKRTPLKPGQAGLLSKLAQIFVIAIAVAAIAYVLRLFAPRFFRARKQMARVKPQPRIVLGEHLEPDESAVDLLSEAEALARQGELRAAIRKAYIALLVELGDRKIISLAQHKTNRDYLRSVSSIPVLYSKMTGLTDSFELHWYGFANATLDDWHHFRAAYKAALHESGN
jgi:hypothetical protein